MQVGLCCIRMRHGCRQSKPAVRLPDVDAEAGLARSELDTVFRATIQRLLSASNSEPQQAVCLNVGHGLRRLSRWPQFAFVSADLRI